MPLQTSGQISLNEIHIEAGGSSGTLCSINDADIRGLLNPTPGSTAQMDFGDWHGASAATFKGSVIDTATGSIQGIILTGVNTIAAVGDLCIIAIASDATVDAAAVTINGMTTTKLQAATHSDPGWLFAYGFRQSGDGDVWFSTTSDNGNALCGILAVFGGVSSLTNYTFNKTVGQPDPPSLGSQVPTKLIVTTAHVDDDYVLMTAPSGYTLASANRGTNNTGKQKSAVAVAYKITSTSQAENPGTFGGANDSYASYTLRFA